jgi:hypothetical protein
LDALNVVAQCPKHFEWHVEDGIVSVGGIEMDYLTEKEAEIDLLNFWR